MPLKRIISLSISLLLSMSVANAQVGKDAESKAIQLYNSSVTLIRNGDFSTAENVLRQAWQILPDDANILCNYGLALMKMGKLQEANERLLRGTQVKPDYDLMWLNLGLVQEGLGDLVSAKASLERFISLAPNNPYSERIKAHIPEIDKLLATGVGPESLSKADYIDELSSDQKQRWSAARMPLKIYLKPGDGVPGYKPSYGAALEAALRDWIHALEGKMSIVKIDNQKSADIVVKWTNDVSAGINRSEGGDVRYLATPAGIDHADVTLLTLDPSPTVRLTDSLVYWISLHELGHGLGIVGHSRNPADVMYFSAPQKVNPQLSSRDVQTIRRLYSEELENWMTLNDQGIKLMHAKKFDEAIVKLEKALKLQPDKTVIKTNIITTEGNHARQLLTENKLDQVEQHFARALDLEEDLRDFNLAMLLNNYSVFLSRVARADEIKSLYAHFGMKPPQAFMATGNAPWQKPQYAPTQQSTPDVNPDANTGETGMPQTGNDPAGTTPDQAGAQQGSTTGGDNTIPLTDEMPPLAPPANSQAPLTPARKPAMKPTASAKPGVGAKSGKPGAKPAGKKPTPATAIPKPTQAKPNAAGSTKPAAAKPSATTPAKKPATGRTAAPAAKR